MSIEAMKAVIARANNDKDFLRLLLSNPDDAIKIGGYDLTEQEVEMIKASQGQARLNDEELEKRVSRGFFRLGP
ncbi:Os1348 family NHLP clan protein [Candidatus Chlorohelix sp.]|uniref:Os1348 family NHLP clan protein n=1 Tax=Candidatus Chlorohelix sp. TaxID=3139201 RepID=UPI00305137EE